MSSKASVANAEAGPGSDFGGLESSEPPSSALSKPNPVSKRPSLPSSFFKFPVRARLKAIQQYINSFEYKQSPQTSFNAHKLRPLARIMDTAKMMIYCPQPIKCVEAVFLALYLTAGIADAERIPLGFKSETHGQVHQHIVLLVRYKDRYGAFGISRQKNLMSKEFDFASLSSIVDNFMKAYEKIEHKVARIRVGLPVEHNIESFNFVCWRYLSLDPSSTPWEQCVEALERHINNAKRLWDRWLLDGQREDRRYDTLLRDSGNTQSTLEIEDRRPRRSRSQPNSEVPTVKAATKRRQDPDKQEPDFKHVKKRHALQEIPIRNIPNQSFCTKKATGFTRRCEGSPPFSLKKSPREPLTTRQCSHCQKLRNESLTTRCPSSSEAFQNNIKKIALKCYSMELFPVTGTSNWRSSLQNNQQKRKLHLDLARKDTRRAKGSTRKPQYGAPVEILFSGKLLIKTSRPAEM